MTNMWCPDCGAEYRAGVTTCADCGVGLVSEPPPDGNRLDDDEGTDVVVYELGDWTSDERGALDLRLQTEAIEHSWEFGEGEEAPAGFDASQPWTLGTDLVVGERDEAVVDAILDEIENPDALEAVGDDDVDDGEDEAEYDVMSHLYVAADRLKDDPANLALVGEFFDAADAASNVKLPFGLDPDLWARAQQLAAGITGALEQEADDEVVAANAKELRDLLFEVV